MFLNENVLETKKSLLILFKFRNYLKQNKRSEVEAYTLDFSLKNNFVNSLLSKKLLINFVLVQ